MVFSDESTFSVGNTAGNEYVRRMPGEKFKPYCILPTVKHPTSVMVWGSISSKGPGELYVVEGTMNAEKYVSVMETKMLPKDTSTKQALIEAIVKVWYMW